MKNPYKILGLKPDTPFEELKARYEALKAEYSEGRFKDGEEGNKAAKNLTELELAWREIEEKHVVAEAVDGSDAGDFGYVDRMIKEGKYDEAQSALDGMSVREGEWHYFQSIVYYKREWLTECKKQLEAAIECDPGNAKYKAAYDRLKLVMGSGQVDPRTLGEDNIHSGTNAQGTQGDTLSNCCLAYCLTTLCCDCSRCCMCFH